MGVISAYSGGGIAAGNLLRAGIALHRAGVSELIARLQAEGVPATYNEIKKGFEYGFDAMFAVLLTGMLTLVLFTI